MRTPWFAARITMIPAFLVLASIFFTSCGEPQVPLTPVKGKITVNGKALTTGNISFRPDNAGGNSSILEPSGDVADDGTYTIFTGKRPGAPVGKYFVLVTAYEPIDPNKPSATAIA